MRPENLCEVCGRPERGYDVLASNRRGSDLRKGGARHPVESFVCSSCTQKLLCSEQNRAVAAFSPEMNTKVRA
jgi:hypothetical protein